MNIDQNELKNRLDYCLNTIGVKQNYVCKNTGIDVPTLSKFKNNKIYLNDKDARNLQNYFDKFFMIEI